MDISQFSCGKRGTGTGGPDWEGGNGRAGLLNDQGHARQGSGCLVREGAEGQLLGELGVIW